MAASLDPRQRTRAFMQANRAATLAMVGKDGTPYDDLSGIFYDPCQVA